MGGGSQRRAAGNRLVKRWSNTGQGEAIIWVRRAQAGCWQGSMRPLCGVEVGRLSNTVQPTGSGAAPMPGRANSAPDLPLSPTSKTTSEDSRQPASYPPHGRREHRRSSSPGAAGPAPPPSPALPTPAPPPQHSCGWQPAGGRCGAAHGKRQGREHSGQAGNAVGLVLNRVRWY